MTTIFTPSTQPALGLAALEAAAAGDSPLPPDLAELPVDRLSAGPGWVRIRLTPADRRVTASHGGPATMLLDALLACAVQTALPAGHEATVVDLRATYLRPVADTAEGEGRVIHVGSTVASAEAKVLDGDGALVAHGTATFLVREDVR